MTTYLIILFTLSLTAIHGLSKDRPKTDVEE